MGGQLVTSTGVLGQGWTANITTVHWTINAVCPDTTGCVNPYEANTIITSAHPRGANFLFCDGSVWFLTQSLDYSNILLRFIARDDGMTVALP